ncbi:ADP-ribosylation factor [Fasciola gigantica]|uniref:ADP-ribosylation factor-like protein 6 n=1 Tax=Fasciola gigantica TaxID=46835 RepID=A0A504YJ41_FASGI|nr:ADP-ribosylation factor [Fasciola gigantica]
MGFLNILAKIFGIFKREVKLLIIGLDNSGKTTILNQLKAKDDCMDFVPTVGFNVERVKRSSLSITCFDMSGHYRYRSLWEKYYSECDGVIFVVDSSDQLRLIVAQDELEQMLSHSSMKNRDIPLLFLSNKMDKTGSLSASQVAQALGLEKIRNKSWNIISSNAISGEGVSEGLDWLCEKLQKKPT